MPPAASLGQRRASRRWRCWRLAIALPIRRFGCSVLPRRFTIAADRSGDAAPRYFSVTATFPLMLRALLSGACRRLRADAARRRRRRHWFDSRRAVDGYMTGWRDAAFSISMPTAFAVVMPARLQTSARSASASTSIGTVAARLMAFRRSRCLSIAAFFTHEVVGYRQPAHSGRHGAIICFFFGGARGAFVKAVSAAHRFRRL